METAKSQFHMIGVWKSKSDMIKARPKMIEFLNTLSHEMLHLWQQTIMHDSGKHNKLFFSFKNKFKKLNLTLSY